MILYCEPMIVLVGRNGCEWMWADKVSLSLTSQYPTMTLSHVSVVLFWGLHGWVVPIEIVHG